MDESDSDDDGTAVEQLQQLQARLDRGRGYDPTLFRVVEVVRGADGRLSKQGQIWHSDLSHVRRFGHALAANSPARRVVIADAAGAVLEQISVRQPDAAPAGWGDWRATVLPPLPPMPPRKVQPARRAAPQAPLAGVAAAPVLPAAATAVPDVPVIDAADDAADVASPADDVAVVLP